MTSSLTGSKDNKLLSKVVQRGKRGDPAKGSREAKAQGARGAQTVEKVDAHLQGSSGVQASTGSAMF